MRYSQGLDAEKHQEGDEGEKAYAAAD